MDRLEVEKLKQGDAVRVRVGDDYRGQIVIVFSTHFGEGNWHGWVKCLTPDGKTFIFAAEELESV